MLLLSFRPHRKSSFARIRRLREQVNRLRLLDVFFHVVRDDFDNLEADHSGSRNATIHTDCLPSYLGSIGTR